MIDARSAVRYTLSQADCGRPRRMPPELAELLVSLKTEKSAKT